MMGCSAEGQTEGFIFTGDENTGIMSGHAYSVIDVFQLPYYTKTQDEKQEKYKAEGRDISKIRGFHRMLRIRNPWGYGQWKLKWSEDPDHPKYDKTLKRYAID